MKQLSVFIPGLFGPLPELAASAIEPATPLLNKMLSRARCETTTASDYYQQLAALLAVDKTVSIAQLSALADGISLSAAHVYRADPVHFKAEVDHALLIDCHQLAVTAPEMVALLDAFNQHFEDDGLQLHGNYPERWYLSLPEKFALETTSLKDAVGRDVKHFLPVGDDALEWRRLLNEAQMLFHMQAVNQQRTDAGRLTINSLWLWGENDLSELVEQAPVEPAIDCIIADEVIARGMAQLAGCPLSSTHNAMDVLAEEHQHAVLVIDTLMGPASYGDVNAWAESVEQLCEQWLKPLYDLLKTKQLAAINLYSAEGRVFHITPARLLTFWRRSRPLTQYIKHANE